jgi:hypothetical protein
MVAALSQLLHHGYQQCNYNYRSNQPFQSARAEELEYYKN